MSYFEDGATLPPPFNIMPSIKWFTRFCKTKKAPGFKRGSTIVSSYKHKLLKASGDLDIFFLISVASQRGKGKPLPKHNAIVGVALCVDQAS